ncbi:phosphoribosyltransferase-like protein [Trichoderma novae-zelandiae]
MSSSTEPQDITTSSTTSQDASGRQPSAASSAAAQLASAQISLRKTLRQFPDFPIPGIDFVDIMPLFANPDAHATLLSALELQVSQAFGASKPDVIVGLDARGFLFGPGLALRLGVGFAAVRKQGKLPGPCVTAEYVKEYGKDLFQMQQDAIHEGQKVLIVDDIIATGELLPIGPRRCQIKSFPVDIRQLTLRLVQVVRRRRRRILFTSSRVRSLVTFSFSRFPASMVVRSSEALLLLSSLRIPKFFQGTEKRASCSYFLSISGAIQHKDDAIGYQFLKAAGLGPLDASGTRTTHCHS